MQVTAIAKNIRISDKKIKFLIDEIKKMSPQQAMSILEFTPKSSSEPLKKVIASAVANAKNNLNLDENSLKFKTISVLRGPAYKRFRPVSRGRAHAILKRTSHITITLTGDAKKAVAAPQPKKEETKTEVKKEQK